MARGSMPDCSVDVQQLLGLRKPPIGVGFLIRYNCAVGDYTHGLQLPGEYHQTRLNAPQAG